MEIKLLDPGDTNALTANLQILIPTASGWSATTFNYTASARARPTAACPTLRLPTRTNVSNVVTIRRRGPGGQPVQRLLDDDPDPDPDDLHARRGAGLVEDPLQHDRLRRRCHTTSRPGRSEIRGNPVHLILP